MKFDKIRTAKNKRSHTRRDNQNNTVTRCRVHERHNANMF